MLIVFDFMSHYDPNGSCQSLSMFPKLEHTDHKLFLIQNSDDVENIYKRFFKTAFRSYGKHAWIYISVGTHSIDLTLIWEKAGPKVLMARFLPLTWNCNSLDTKVQQNDSWLRLIIMRLQLFIIRFTDHDNWDKVEGCLLSLLLTGGFSRVIVGA